MAMIIDEKNSRIIINIPNSEASVSAQHNGIVDRSVGSYYMSEKQGDCIDFLCGLEGDFYIDLLRTLHNAEKIINKLIEVNLKKAFKQELNPQISAIETLKWLIDSEKNFLHKIANPTINENNKYLKFDNSDNYFDIVKTLALGDLTTLTIQKIGKNGYIIYVDCINDFDELIKSNKILKWFK